MVSRIKTSLLVFLVLFIYLSSAGTVKGFSNGASSTYSLHEVGAEINSRKLLSRDEVDYDDAGANTKHDPRGKRGGGGKNP